MSEELSRENVAVQMLMRLLCFVMLLVLAGCATLPPPKNKENVAAIFNEYPQWYQAVKKTEKKWGVPAYVQMAIIYYESAFKADARPPRRRLLGFIPGKHITSAYGYAQALDGTWKDYLSAAGGFFSSRTKFESATDFIGWYSMRARDCLGIPLSDPYNLYLAYHEGLGGFARKSYLKKPWLIHYAQNVAEKSQIFQSQLSCYEHGTNRMAMPLQDQNLLETKRLDLSPLPELEAPNYSVMNNPASEVEESI